MKINKTYKSPCLLVGNGINNYTGSEDFSWKKIITDMAVEAGIEKKVCDAILDSRDITYPEFWRALSRRANTDINGNVNYAALKEKLREKIVNLKGGAAHRALINYARKNNIPVLTTNYDETFLADNIGWKRRVRNGYRLPAKMNNIEHFTHQYPIHSYFSDHEIQDPVNEFGIWHIHGLAGYKKSMIIGAEEYYSFIAWFTKKLAEKGKNHQKESWNDKNSWLDILFHRDVIIIGLGLGTGEIGIRRLLDRRQAYIEKQKLDYKTLYVESDKNGINPGKRFFLESLDIEIKEIKQAEEIYEEW